MIFSVTASIGERLARTDAFFGGSRRVGTPLHVRGPAGQGCRPRQGLGHGKAGVHSEFPDRRAGFLKSAGAIEAARRLGADERALSSAAAGGAGLEAASNALLAPRNLASGET